MVYYDVDLKKEGVQQLDTSFGEPPFSVNKSDPKKTKAYVDTGDGNPTEFMCYDDSVVIIYRGVISHFPTSIQTTINRKLDENMELKKVLHPS